MVYFFRERIANIINIVITPWWGVIQPKSTEWITMTVYTLQEPATFTYGFLITLILHKMLVINYFLAIDLIASNL